jgi:hypothetical protein
LYKRLRYFEIRRVPDAASMGAAALPRWRADPNDE